MALILKDKRIETTIRLARQAFGGYKWQIILLTILGFFSGLLEGIGVNALIPLFSFLTNKDGQASDFISQTIERLFVTFNVNFNVKYLMFFIVALFIFRAIVLTFCNYLKTKITRDYEENLRNSVFKKTIEASWSYLLKQKMGYLDNILMNDVGQGSSLLNHISVAIMLFTSLFIYTFVAVNISFYMTLVTFIFGGIIFLTFKPLIYKSKIVSRQLSETYKEVAHYIDENIVGMKTVKAFNVDLPVITKGEGYFRKLKEIYIRTFVLRYVGWAFIQPLGFILICGIFVFFYRSPDFNIASLIAISYLIQKIFVYIQDLQSTFHSINESAPFLINVLSYESNAQNNREQKGGKKKFQFNSQIEFKNVSFYYQEKKDILSKINFSINKGEMAGLIGPSGAGKTTIVDLILRLFNPTGGEILIDGTNIKEINIDNWRENIGYVSHDIFLLNSTIADNIRFYNSSLAQADLIAAAKMANIYDFIKGCPQGFDTIVGERGILLSAGQRQRIVIARVLAQKPKFLIFDEATSALDNESEGKIQEVINNLKGKITTFVIAHRLTTVIDADKMLVLKDGAIIEQGNPGVLLDNNQSYFYKMYHLKA